MKKITFKSMLFFAMIVANTNSYSQVQVIMDCEDGTTSPLVDVFANGPGSSIADITIVDNPNPVGNTSLKVAKFLRRTEGADAQTYAGVFASGLTVDFTTNKYVHVKVLKSKISPVKFKIEGGPDGNREIASTEPFTAVDSWQDMVYLITESGIYPTVVFFPDFEDPLLTPSGDIDVYFDDIIVNNDPTPSLGVVTNVLKNNIAIYPTSIKNDLNINSVDKIEIVSIFNVQGKKVYEAKNLESGTNQINTSNFSNGLYIISIITKNGGKLNQKLVKK